MFLKQTLNFKNLGHPPILTASDSKGESQPRIQRFSESFPRDCNVQAKGRDPGSQPGNRKLVLSQRGPLSTDSESLGLPVTSTDAWAPSRLSPSESPGVGHRNCSEEETDAPSDVNARL